MVGVVVEVGVGMGVNNEEFWESGQTIMQLVCVCVLFLYSFIFFLLPLFVVCLLLFGPKGGRGCLVSNPTRVVI